ncbi:hypothetical protein GKA01_10130 [Gluconobacter kanchanaburiensis NBRC 103587]|uniref:Formate hydrogenlyase subunit 4 n=2 Tax=Gluconobacter kanchanaburiensis TaxID=563199 RepID=A0A511B5V2_9PROT|nr:hypothetical protein AA103587_0747 [Gluconobacter kanchanaburiensis NBRC 103587]GEK95816.1 hypothetical protein GKA01_10130 [Gluconobacter kanchanaburiensis NBRC 103587]
MHEIGMLLLTVLELLFQLVLLLVLAPLMGWCLDELPLWLGGRGVSPLRFRLLRSARFWGGLLKVPLAGPVALALTTAILTLSCLPAITTGSALSGLADPLMMGLLVLLGRGFLARFLLQGERGRLGAAFLLLCLTEALIALAAPGTDGLAGLCAMLHIEPEPGLEGALAACALALGIACPPLRGEDVTRMLCSVRDQQEREATRSVADILNCGWLLLLADLSLPVSVGLAQGGVAGWWLGLMALAVRLVLTVMVVIGLRLMAQECSARLTALFAGVALLLALAGRFGT